MLLRGLLLAALSFGLQAQTQAPDDRYQALKNALGLSDSQLVQLQQKSPAEIVNRSPMPMDAQRVYMTANPLYGMQRPFPFEQDPSKYALLDDSQKAKLGAIIDKIWRHPPTERLAIAIELTSAYQWPIYPCPYELHGAVSDLDLTSSQLLQLQVQRQSGGPSLVPEIDWREWRRKMELESGWHDAPSVVKSVSELPALREQAARRRDLALAVLDDAQKANLAEFEAALQLLSEARALRLIPLLGGGEALCQ